MSIRAHARRRLAAWDRYHAHYPDPAVRRIPMLRHVRVTLRLGRADGVWRLRARRHRADGRRR